MPEESKRLPGKPVRPEHAEKKVRPVKAEEPKTAEKKENAEKPAEAKPRISRFTKVLTTFATWRSLQKPASGAA